MSNRCRDVSSVGFYEKINSNNTISREEERELMKRASKGDKEAQNKLVTANIQYSIFAANNISYSNVKQDDLYQACIEGLVKASRKIKKEYINNKFLTYAHYYIIDEARNAIKKNTNVYLPMRRFEKMKRIKSVYDNYSAEGYSHKKCIELTASFFDKSEREINEYLRHCEQNLSLDEIWDEDSNSKSTLGDMIIDKKYKSPEEEFLESDTKKIIWDLVNELPENEAYIVIKHNGLDGKPIMTFEEIAKEMGVTRATINMREKRAKNRLMKHREILESLIA